MVRYRSDESDEDRNSSRKYKKKSKSKKRRGRSRSGSDSESSHLSSSRGKKAKKKYGRSSRSPSRERDQGRSSRRSRSSSYDRYYSSSRRSRSSKTRSPSSRKNRYSRSPYHSRSRSPSTRKGRRSRSPSWTRDQRRRSRSYSREKRSRSGGRSQSRRSSSDSKADATSADMKSRMNLLDQSGQSGASLTVLTPAQQAEERMRLALKAAAAADQKLRQLPYSGRDSPASSATVTAGADNSQPKFANYEESQNFASSVAKIESGNFSQATFKSSRSATKPQEASTFDSIPSHDDAIFGSLAVTGFTLKPDPDTKPIDLDPESIMHPSLFCDPEEKMDRWIERLTQLRKRKLEGDAL